MHGSRAHPQNLASQAVHPTTHGLGIPLSKVGFPIRISADQSSFPAPHGFWQRSTSFIASQRQGIHRMPLRHLIALIINAHPLGSGTARAFFKNSSIGWSLIRKTSLSSDRSDGVRSSSRHKHRSTTRLARTFRHDERSRSNARRLRIDHDLRHDRLSERSYLFTMSDISQSSRAHTYGLAARTDGRGIVFDGRALISKSFSISKRHSISKSLGARSRLVEPDGIEPTTSCLQSRRSPN